MGRQVRGTFLVKDHCVPDAFIAEIMLYDHLVIQVPPDDKELQYWYEYGWRPEPLNKLLDYPGDTGIAWYLIYNVKDKDSAKAFKFNLSQNRWSSLNKEKISAGQCERCFLPTFTRSARNY